ncbi:MAG: M23 family metallopeptidase [Bacteroidota bacterium]
MKGLKPKSIILPVVFIGVFLLVVRKCSFHALPQEKLHAIKLDIEESYKNDTYQLTITNPVDCPNRFLLSCVDEKLIDFPPILLEAKADTTIRIIGQGNLKGKMKIHLKWGDPSLPIQAHSISQLPYPQHKRYQLLQGNNSNPTHNYGLSRYAFDFTMEIGDTVTSTQNGYVVAVIDGYKGWGSGDKWKPYVNQVMIYDTTSHLFTMYGHLMQDGSLVEAGQYVTVGQPIGLSGKTGQTTEEHLHFNVLKADKGKRGLQSYPLDSIGNYKVKTLERYQWMEN